MKREKKNEKEARQKAKLVQEENTKKMEAIQTNVKHQSREKNSERIQS